MSAISVAVHARNRQRYQFRRGVNAVMLGLTSVATVVAILPLIWILGYVLQEGGRFLSLDFFTQLPTPVGVPGGGVANAIVGSAILVGLACLFAIPPALLAAIYAHARPNTPLGLALRFGTDVLSGVPSIVVGIFAYTVVVLPLRRFSALAGGLALAVIMLPIIIRATEEMLKLVPKNLREGSLALGAPEWKTQLRVMLPAALDGVVTGVMLGIARVAGEAAPLVLTSFGNPFWSTDVTQPMAALPHMIFVYAIAPYKDWHDKAWTTALVLIVLVLGLNIAARLLISWRRRQLGA
ncbi:MAG: phosphate ABC transporter, permease protein PstA [Chloroflexi bacterium RBG_16_57_9]|nr:MAG: phosphate ABC transporter, permease protein PstA [Chloroflexi bacterium RBG_16_57_9]